MSETSRRVELVTGHMQGGNTSISMGDGLQSLDGNVCRPEDLEERPKVRSLLEVKRGPKSRGRDERLSRMQMVMGVVSQPKGEEKN